VTPLEAFDQLLVAARTDGELDQHAIEVVRCALVNGDSAEALIADTALALGAPEGSAEHGYHAALDAAVKNAALVARVVAVLHPLVEGEAVAPEVAEEAVGRAVRALVIQCAAERSGGLAAAETDASKALRELVAAHAASPFVSLAAVAISPPNLIRLGGTDDMRDVVGVLKDLFEAAIAMNHAPSVEADPGG